MKPTEKQKAVAKVVEQQGQFWQSTNDINSPTHYGDIQESLFTLSVENIITDEEEKLLDEKLGELYTLIKNFK